MYGTEKMTLFVLHYKWIRRWRFLYLHEHQYCNIEHKNVPNEDLLETQRNSKSRTPEIFGSFCYAEKQSNINYFLFYIIKQQNPICHARVVGLFNNNKKLIKNWTESQYASSPWYLPLKNVFMVLYKMNRSKAGEEELTDKQMDMRSQYWRALPQSVSWVSL